MEDSILISIKKLLGITDSYDAFDMDIIFDINAALALLTELGVGPPTGFSIEDDTATWTDFMQGLEEDPRYNSILHIAKLYIFLKVKSVFDPSLSSAVITATAQEIDELEWRISVLVD